MGYDGPKRDWRGLELEIQGCHVGQKESEKQYSIFEPYLTIVPVKVEFLGTDFFMEFQKIKISFTKSQINWVLTAQYSFISIFWIWIQIMQDWTNSWSPHRNQPSYLCLLVWIKVLDNYFYTLTADSQVYLLFVLLVVQLIVYNTIFREHDFM